MKRVIAAIPGTALLWAGLALPQPLTDPMRPPMLGAPAPGAGRSGPQLQAILIRPTLREAVIDGQPVGIGTRFGDARVARITETEVLLRDEGGGTRVLRLLPLVDKKTAAPAKPGTPAAQGRERTR